MSRIQPTHPFVPFTQDEVEQSVPARFEAIVRRDPRRLAVKMREQPCTYEALNRTANQVAHALLAARGAGAEPIAFLLEQSTVALATIFGILKAGKCYVPLDPTLPRARLTTILEDVQPGLLITNNHNLAVARSLTNTGCQVLNTDTLAAGLSTENPGLALSPDTLASILYTSGSTGRPKGVVQNHRNILHHGMRVANILHISADDRIALLASLGTGQGQTVMFYALLSGAALYPRHVKEEGLTHLAAWLRQEEMTIYHSSATVFRAFVDTLAGGESFPKLRLLRVGSETVSPTDVEHYKALFPPDCLLLNSLSSTETGTIRMYLMNKETSINGSTVPVGYAVAGVEVLLLDENGAEVEVNQPGEIVVKSRYLSPGYWRQPDLTAAVFLPDPQGGDERLYRTGDLGYRLPDGCLVHLGRQDFRVKVRGHRIEVAEVEQVLRGHAEIKDVVVMAQPNHAGEHHLVAYVVPAQEPGPSIRALQDLVRQTLPDYMVPAVFIQLAALPLTPGGKVDRQQLPTPGRIRPQLVQPYVGPRTPIEVELVRLWTQALGVEQVGIHDAFLELGGDSLLAMRLVVRVQEAFQVDVPLRSLLEAPTVADMAVAITQRLAGQVEQATMARLLTEVEELSAAEAQPGVTEASPPRRGHQ